MSPEARARKAAEAADLGRKNRKEVCKNGHRRTIENTRVVQSGKYLQRFCRDCERERWPKRYAASLPPGLVKAGMSNKQIGMQKWWADARRKHGDKGYSAEEIELRRQRGRVIGRLATPSLRTHCKKRGHPLTAGNVVVQGGKRLCRACREIRQRGRPAWLDVKGVRVSIEAHDAYFLARWKALRSVMVAAHPDKGGTSRKFRKAKQALDAFMDAERMWYAAVQLDPPISGHRRRSESAEAVA